MKDFAELMRVAAETVWDNTDPEDRVLNKVYTTDMLASNFSYYGANYQTLKDQCEEATRF